MNSSVASRKVFGVFVCFVFFLFFAGGCAVVQLPKDYVRDIEYGKIVTPGVVIEDVMGGFRLVSGEVFTPPFQSTSMWWAQKDGRGVLYCDFCSGNDWANNGAKKTIDYFDTAVSRGARKVMVTVPGVEQKLFGVLFLGKAHVNATGPASRSYQIQIPDSYIKAALGGKISVVYEPINFRTNWYTGSNPVDSKTHSWILWLSDMPFTKKISFQGTGFHFNKKTGRIEGVYPGSPAADNGLAVGDFILSIDGVPYADYRNGNGGSSTRTVVMTKAKSDERKTVTMPVVELSY